MLVPPESIRLGLPLYLSKLEENSTFRPNDPELLSPPPEDFGLSTDEALLNPDTNKIKRWVTFLSFFLFDLIMTNLHKFSA